MSSGVEKKRDVLSTHSTFAKFEGREDRKCLFLTSLCPDHCGHGGAVANFKILKYLAYEKKGEYGDPKSDVFIVSLKDTDVAMTPEHRATVEALAPGDAVALAWRHDYVTMEYEGGCSSSSPQRPVTELRKLGEEEKEEMKK